MPPSDDSVEPDVPGSELATAAEALYLANLLVLPGIGFLVLLWLYGTRHRSSPPLAADHLCQTLRGSLWAGGLLILANALILLLGGYRVPGTWTVLIVYFTVCHSTLVLYGIVGLAKAMAGQCWRYPLIGCLSPADCPRGR